MNIKLMRAYYDGPEYMAKLRVRAEHIRQMAEDEAYREQAKRDVYGAPDGFERFCEDFLWLIIPEFGDAIKPFFLFPYQKRIIARMYEAEALGGDVEMLVDKPRGMGISWLFIAYFYWKWLFVPNWSAFILSRTETEVDDGTASPGNSLFSKIRWLIMRTPKWLLPVGFEPKGKKGTATDSSLRLLNPIMGTAIVGSSTNSNAGRSKRYSVVFVDECFAIEHFTEVHRALSSVARIQVYVSTTKASMEAKKFKDVVELSGWYVPLEWRDHPWKDQEWYEDQIRRAEFDPEIMKEVDKGYSVSEKLQYYPEVKFARMARLIYNPKLPLYCGVDFGKGDLTVIIWAQFDGNQINLLECYWNKGKGKVEWYAPFMNPETEIDHGFQYTQKALDFMAVVRSWVKPTAWFGELAHKIASMADNKSIATVLAKFGIKILYNTYAVEYEPRRKATSILFEKIVFNEASEGVTKLHDAIANSRYKKAGSSEKTSKEPVHDEEIADFRAALENLCVNVGRILKHQRSDISESMKKDGYVDKLIKFLKI